MRILSIGSELETADVSCTFGDNPNIKDYDVIFIDLTNPISLTEIRELDKPKRDDLFKLTKHDGDIFAVTSRHVNPEHEPNPISYLDLPIEIELERSGTIDSVKEEWEWYFNTESSFNWGFWIQDSTKPLKSGYTNECIDVSDIATNRYGRSVASVIKLGNIGRTIDASKHPYVSEMDTENNGRIYILPLIEGKRFKQVANEILQKLYEVNIESSADETPDWLDKYSTDKQKEVLDEIRELEEKIKTKKKNLEGVQKYKQLLYEKGKHTLEPVVRDALREIGLDVDKGREGEEDGIIRLEDKDIVLEITGVNGGVPEGKCKQLMDNRNDISVNLGDSDKTVEGLLIANPYHDQDPEERKNIVPDGVVGILRREGDMRLITTTELFKIIKSHIDNEITEEEAREILMQDDEVIKYEDGSLT